MKHALEFVAFHLSCVSDVDVLAIGFLNGNIILVIIQVNTHLIYVINLRHVINK